MGLDTSHGCWNGPYSQFMRWRIWLADQVGIPMMLMDGFCNMMLTIEDLELVPKDDWDFKAAINNAIIERPIPWDCIGDPIKILLDHSDCEGKIKWWECKILAMRLVQLLKNKKETDRDYIPGPDRGCYDGMVPATRRFIKGLMIAYKAKEDVIFR